uniref:ABC-F family ATP-binding cassette domain-containing protein n=1 Tax=Herbidospora sakaeratensis TaxID=564415 RepID=UPI0007854D60|nr:ABC-F family ATP-binding cassette domain-containing protein [Herbidospora sakaeratensis]
MLRCDDLFFYWADGTPVFEGLDLVIGPGVTGLIGVNGSGKSTLLKLAAGELVPIRGSIQVSGSVGHLPQNLPLGVRRTVSDLMGITEARRALHAIEAGDTAEEHFENVVWDVEERARAELDKLGLDDVGLDRTVATLSGGETVMVGLAAEFLRAPDVLLLDEPTNNLDLAARHRLYDAVTAWPGTIVVVSHDRVLLDLVDRLAELPDGRIFGGGLTAYEDVLDVEQEAAERMVRAAEGEVRREKRDLAEAHEKIARRAKNGRKAALTKGLPKIAIGARKRAAQESAGKHRILHEERLSDARDRLTEAEDAVRDDAEIRVDLPGTAVPQTRMVLEFPLGGTFVTDRDVSGPLEVVPERRGREPSELVIRGPERIALLGPNGSGKTTLLEAVTRWPALVPTRYLPQRLDVLDETVSIADNVRAVAPGASENEIRAGLARFLFRGDRADQIAGTLSGGERFRAALARLLFAQPQLLLLDEPTNNLDLASVRQLAGALSAYRGALIVASHDLPFLDSIGVTRRLDL